MISGERAGERREVVSRSEEAVMAGEGSGVHTLRRPTAALSGAAAAAAAA